MTGSHRKLLERLGTAMLMPFTVPKAKEEDGDEGRNEWLPDSYILVGRAAASTGVLGAIMDVEHRALHARLDSLWDVVWLSASQTSAAGAICVSITSIKHMAPRAFIIKTLIVACDHVALKNYDTSSKPFWKAKLAATDNIFRI